MLSYVGGNKIILGRTPYHVADTITIYNLKSEKLEGHVVLDKILSWGQPFVLKIVTQINNAPD